LFDDVGFGHPVPRQLILQGSQIQQQIIELKYPQGVEVSVQRRLGGRQADTWKGTTRLMTSQ